MRRNTCFENVLFPEEGPFTHNEWLHRIEACGLGGWVDSEDESNGDRNRNASAMELKVTIVDHPASQAISLEMTKPKTTPIVPPANEIMVASTTTGGQYPIASHRQRAAGRFRGCARECWPA